MQKVLVLTSTYPLDGGDSQPRFVEYLCQGMRHKFDLTVLAPAILGARGANNLEGLCVRRFRYFFAPFERLCGGSGILENLKSSPWLYGLIPFLLLAQLITTVRLLKSKSFDVIHAHWIIPQGLVAVLACYFVKQPPQILLTSHGGDLFALNGWLTRKLKVFILGKAAHITVVSDAMRAMCINEFEVQPSRVSVISMGVDLQNTFIPGNSKHSNSLVFVGRLAEKKGLNVLLEALSTLKSRPNLDVTIIGGGNSLVDYQRHAKALSLDECVSFTGALPNEEIVSYLQRAAIAVFPFVVAKDGDQEGLGLTMVEAMGCECLVIASELPAVRDVIQHEHTGLLVEAGNPLALAQSIEYVLESKRNHQEITLRARKYALNTFDWAHIANRYSHVIESLAND